MKFPSLVPALFLSRPNRFVAVVRLENGKQARAYVPTTGRLTHALDPGCRVWLEDAKAPHRKTHYTLHLAELASGGYCGIQAVQANQLFAEAVAAGRLSAFNYDQVQAEVAVGGSRLDFQLSDDTGLCWVEVKSVTYAVAGVGKFPDAPTGRGRRHLIELARLAQSGDRACVVFIVQREDAQSFTPFTEIDPGFAQTLREVGKQGVEVHAYRCRLDLNEVEIHQAIPVRL